MMSINGQALKRIPALNKTKTVDAIRKNLIAFLLQ